MNDILQIPSLFERNEIARDWKIGGAGRSTGQRI